MVVVATVLVLLLVLLLLLLLLAPPLLLLLLLLPPRFILLLLPLLLPLSVSLASIPPRTSSPCAGGFNTTAFMACGSTASFLSISPHFIPSYPACIRFVPTRQVKSEYGEGVKVGFHFQQNEMLIDYGRYKDSVRPNYSVLQARSPLVVSCLSFLP